MTNFSVVIPAHNEEKVLGRCLAFVSQLRPGEAEVIVVPNGCTDRTADVAAKVPGVTVVSLPEGAKWRALNAGDAAATAFPRIYLDADIVLSAETLRALAAALSDGQPRVAAPRVEFRVQGRPFAVRAFYEAYERLPYVRNGLTGLGVFGLSKEGRARFAEFLDVTADDLFVQRLFPVTERLVLQDVTFLVEVPRTLRSLVHVRTRTAFGSAQLAQTGADAFAPSTKETLRELARLMVRQPRLLPAVIVYVAVTVIARVRARAGGKKPSQWNRDATTR